jgi:hypothetical protein
MTANEGSEPAPRWFGVKCVRHDAVRNAYEERVTVWHADSFEESDPVAERGEGVVPGTEPAGRSRGGGLVHQ